MRAINDEAARALCRLGEALNENADRVLEGVQTRNARTTVAISESASQSLERVCTLSTIAVSRWMAGEDPRAGLSTGREAWEIFGQLAAHGEAPLKEVTKRCLRWRDAMEDVMGELVDELRLAPAVLAQAKSMLRVTLDATIVRVCEVFEIERARIGEELERRQEELVFMATHDPLTGLPNRTLILDRCTQMLARARRSSGLVAALVIDFDNFKSINDTLGHTAGDELLSAVAARLDGLVRDADALGRVGGDEFVVLVEDLAQTGEAELVAARIQEALRAPFTPNGTGHTPLTLTASIGIATAEHGGAEEMLRDADIAMHRAKRDGKDRSVVFESDMQKRVRNQVELEMDLRRALSREEFFLVYQPTFDLREMAPTGMEALIRWRHPGRGLVQPGDFIPLLEETGLIVDVGRWVLRAACDQAACWREAGHPVGIAVNVSARQLDTDEFVQDVRAALQTSGLPAAALTLEITETTIMRDAEETRVRLHAIKQLGVRVAIDDFGTGYSSLSHLQRFPVDSLKIDRSFVSQLAANPEGRMLVRTLVQLGKALSIETLAEGIELDSELELLRAERCDSGQGFLFAHPLEVAEADVFLRSAGARALSLPLAVGAKSGRGAPQRRAASVTVGRG